MTENWVAGPASGITGMRIEKENFKIRNGLFH
jgi:hypothetical protein